MAFAAIHATFYRISAIHQISGITEYIPASCPEWLVINALHDVSAKRYRLMYGVTVTKADGLFLCRFDGFYAIALLASLAVQLHVIAISETRY